MYSTERSEVEYVVEYGFIFRRTPHSGEKNRDRL